MLPADRLSGIGLDALQKPQKNFIKVLFMASINIIGDVIAIKLTGQLEWVAFASVLNVATGIVAGNWLLNKTGALSTSKVYSGCIDYSKAFVRDSVKRFRVKPV